MGKVKYLYLHMLILVYIVPTNIVLFFTQKTNMHYKIDCCTDTESCMCSHEIKTVLCAYTINTHLGFTL